MRSPVLSGLLQASAGNARHSCSEVHMVDRLGTEFWFLAPSSLLLVSLLLTPTFNSHLVSVQTNPD